jgi:hypothetical protein
LRLRRDLLDRGVVRKAVCINWWDLPADGWKSGFYKYRV